MSIELALIKRGALHRGEIGLFAVDSWTETDLQSLGSDMAWAKVWTPRSLQYLRYIWAIAQKLADGGVYEDKDAAMMDLKIRAHFADYGFRKGQPVIIPRSLAAEENNYDALRRLAERFIQIICTELLPDMPESQFRKSLEEMIS